MLLTKPAKWTHNTTQRKYHSDSDAPPSPLEWFLHYPAAILKADLRRLAHLRTYTEKGNVQGPRRIMDGSHARMT